MYYYLVKGEVDYSKMCRKKGCSDCFYGGHEFGMGHFEEKVEAPDPAQAIVKALGQIKKTQTPKGVLQKDVYWSPDAEEPEVELLGKVPDEIILKRKGYQTLWDTKQGAA